MTRRLSTFTALIPLLLLPFLVHMLGSTGSRFFTDDYCIYVEAASANPVELTAKWYGDSGGRLAQYLSLATIFKGDVGMARVMPSVLLSLWIGGLIWLGVEVAQTLRLPSALGVVGTLFMGAATLAGAPNFVQAVYWLTGILTYIAPCVFGTWAAALVVRIGRRSKLMPINGIALFALCLIAGLFNEPFVMLQGALIGSAFLVTLVLRRRVLYLALGLAAAATVLALAIIVIAPGNNFRQQSFVAAPSFTTALGQSVAYAFAFTALVIYTNPIGIFGALLMGMTLPALAQASFLSLSETGSRSRTRNYRRAFAAGLLLLLAVCTAFMLPGFYATQAPPPARSFIILLSIYLPFCLVLGALFRLAIAKSRRENPSIDHWNGRLVVAFVLGLTVWSVLSGLGTAQYALNFGSEWDQQAVELRTAAETDNVIIAPLEHDLGVYAGLETISGDPGNGLNGCAATYYGLRSLRASSADS